MLSAPVSGHLIVSPSEPDLKVPGEPTCIGHGLDQVPQPQHQGILGQMTCGLGAANALMPCGTYRASRASNIRYH
jgi:hypothetical protein